MYWRKEKEIDLKIMVEEMETANHCTEGEEEEDGGDCLKGDVGSVGTELVGRLARFYSLFSSK